MSAPSPAQLQAAGLVALPNTALEAHNNGWAVSKWDPVTQTFAKVSTAAYGSEPVFYAVTGWDKPRPVPGPTTYTITFNSDGGSAVSPIPAVSGSSVRLPTPTQTGFTFNGWFTAPTGGSGVQSPFTVSQNVTLYAQWTAIMPPPNVGPLGIAIPAVEAGYVRDMFDDFKGATIDNSIWTGVYTGEFSGSGCYAVGAHAVTKGDSLLRLQEYPDPAGVALAWLYNAATASASNYWGGSGLQTVKTYGLNTTFGIACEWDTYPGCTPIMLLMGRAGNPPGAPGWPPEIDILEINAAMHGGAPSPYMLSYHYASPNSQFQVACQVEAGVDLSKAHLWVFKTTSTGASLTVTDPTGNVVATSSAVWADHGSAVTDPTNLAGFATPQFMALQHQNGDPNQSPADPTITAENPIEFRIDFAFIDVAA